MPIQDHLDIFHLVREMPASDKTALQCVMEVDEERIRLEALAEELAMSGDDGKVDFHLALLDMSQSSSFRGRLGDVLFFALWIWVVIRQNVFFMELTMCSCFDF